MHPAIGFMFQWIAQARDAFSRSQRNEAEEIDAVDTWGDGANPRFQTELNVTARLAASGTRTAA